MLPHPTTAHAVAELRRQEWLAFAASQRLVDGAVVPTPHAAGSERRRLDLAAVLRVMLSGFMLQPRPRVWTQAS